METLLIGELESCEPGRIARSAPASIFSRAATAAIPTRSSFYIRCIIGRSGPAGRRYARAAICVALLALFTSSSCTTPRRSPHPDLARVWRDFVALPAERALAVAGDPSRDRWVAGFAGGCSTSEEARAKALEACRERRQARRLVAACEVYADGDDIVWRAR